MAKIIETFSHLDPSFLCVLAFSSEIITRTWYLLQASGGWFILNSFQKQTSPLDSVSVKDVQHSSLSSSHNDMFFRLKENV